MSDSINIGNIALIAGAGVIGYMIYKNNPLKIIDNGIKDTRSAVENVVGSDVMDVSTNLAMNYSGSGISTLINQFIRGL